MRCDEAQELITGLVDDELTVTERVATEEHLAECRDCRAQFERETALKRDMKLAASAVVVPQALREKIKATRGGLLSPARETKGISVREWLAAPRLRPVYGFAFVALIVAAAVLFQWRSNENIPTMALAIHENIVSGKTALVRVNDAAQLRKKLTLAVNDRFGPIALDLSMIKLYPVAGFVERIGDRDILVTVYEGDGATVTCFTLLGDEADAPRDSERVFDPDRKINFYAFSRGEVNGVIHREGQVICLLVSKMALPDLLSVARGKPHA
jgi:predicted anti-sigma-YlaC factor YlaD